MTVTKMVLRGQNTMRFSSCAFSTSARAVSLRKKAQRICNAPPSLGAIPDDVGESVGDAGAFIRPVGTTRRVFLIKPHFTPDELSSLAYRIRSLTRNDSLSSVLIATDNDDPAETNALPSSLLQLDSLKHADDFPLPEGKTWHVSGGYDPAEIYQTGLYRSSEAVQSLMESIQNLALATRGDNRKSFIPVITLPHGMINDSGYALCLSSYVLATNQTCFRILNPSRGLSLDPVGFSWILPRLGQEFNQVSSTYSGCGMILALTGYEADCSDMVETGLATHYLDSPDELATFERALSELRPWNQQEILQNPLQFEGQPPPTDDHNAQFRNVSVASTVHAFAEFHADGGDVWGNEEDYLDAVIPVAFDNNPLPFQVERNSDLVHYAAFLDDVFKKEKSMEGILEGLREVAARKSSDPEEQEGIAAAATFVQRMEQQSPLALRVTHQLMKLGQRKQETLQTCMEREKKVQAKMIAQPDFASWASTIGLGNDSAFTGWKHKAIAEVTTDEVDEIIG